jgi:hypothetical protein
VPFPKAVELIGLLSNPVEPVEASTSLKAGWPV